MIESDDSLGLMIESDDGLGLMSLI